MVWLAELFRFSGINNNCNFLLEAKFVDACMVRMMHFRLPDDKTVRRSPAFKVTDFKSTEEPPQLVRQVQQKPVADIFI